jgi:hypothetical protein
MRLPDPTVPFDQQPEDILLTMCLFGEALNQGESARRGVLNAAKNRLIHWRPEYGERTWHGVLLKPWAFSCFMQLQQKLLYPLEHETVESWEGCYNLAQDMLNGLIQDNIERSTFYYDKSMDQNPPSWTRTDLLEHVLDIGSLHFWRYYEGD